MNSDSCVRRYVMAIPSYKIIDKMENILNIASDSTRIKILYCLLGEDDNAEEVEKTVSEIVELTGASQSLISHQLKVLKDADLVRTRKDRQKVYYSLSDGHIKELINVVKEHVLEKE